MTTPLEVKNETKNFFASLLTLGEGFNEEEIASYHHPAVDFLEILQPVTEGELEQIISFMGKKRAPGLSGIPVEAFSNLPKEFRNFFVQLLSACLQLQTCPEECCLNMIVLIPKYSEGAPNLNNYRPISLLEVPKKVLLG